MSLKLHLDKKVEELENKFKIVNEQLSDILHSDKDQDTINNLVQARKLELRYIKGKISGLQEILELIK